MSFTPQDQLSLQLIQSLGQQVQKGIQQNRENNILEEILPQAQQAQDPNDFINALLQLQTAPGLSPETRQQQIQGLQPIAQLAQQQQKLEQQEQKLEQEQLQQQSLSSVASQVSGLPPVVTENLPVSSNNTIIRESLRTRDIESPNELAFKQLQDPILKNIGTFQQDLSKANRLLDLSVSGDVGVDFSKDETAANKIRSAARLFGIDVPANADEAQLQSLVLDRADELKKKFGARITDFDLRTWLQGMPEKFKFRNANIALSLMKKEEALMNKEMFDAWQEVVNDPNIPEERRINALLQRQQEIIEDSDKRLNNRLQQLKKNPGRKFQPDAITFEDEQGNTFVVPKGQVSKFQQEAAKEGRNIQRL